MWGFGGRHYWGRKERGKVEGIVVVFAWMSSQDRHLKNYVDLYSSPDWKVRPSQFLNLFFPSLALEIVSDLVQIIEGKCQEQANVDDYRLVRDCVAGYIVDSSPVDFTSDLGTRFVLHPTVLKMSHPTLIVSLIANGISSILDTLFLGRFESQRAEYWQTLYSTVSMGAPYVIFCSEDDDLAPIQIICNFVQMLKDLGADVKLAKWINSSHVVEYKAVLTELLGKASVLYSQRIRKLGEKMGLEGMHYDI